MGGFEASYIIALHLLPHLLLEMTLTLNMGQGGLPQKAKFYPYKKDDESHTQMSLNSKQGLLEMKPGSTIYILLIILCRGWTLPWLL